MAASLSGVFNVQELTDLGNLLVGGRLYTYEPNTTTQKIAYTDAAATVPHTYTDDGMGGQYIALNGRGELPGGLYLVAGGYDLALKTAAGATIWTRRASGIAAEISSLFAAASGSSLIGFVADGVGAYLRTLQDKGRDEISLRDYIPSGFDTANNDIRSYLQAALLFGAGKRLYCPRSEYAVGADVSLPDNTDICGDGPGTVFKFSNPNLNGFIASGKNGVTLRDFSVSVATTGTAPYIGAVQLNTCTNCRVLNLNLSGMSWSGVLLRDSNRCEVSGVRTSGWRGSIQDSHCIGIYGNSNYNNVHHNFCYGAGDHGIFLQDPYTGATPTGNVITDNQVGGGHKAYGIVGYVTTAYDTKTLIANNVVRDVLGTQLFGASGAGIFAQSLGGTTIIGNTVENCCRSTTNFETLGMGGISASVGEYGSGSPVAINIIGNHVDAVRGPCIYASASNRPVVVEGNICRSLGIGAVRGEAIIGINVRGFKARGNVIDHANSNYFALRFTAAGAEYSYFDISGNTVQSTGYGGISVNRSGGAFSNYGVIAQNNVQATMAGSVAYSVEGSRQVRFEGNHGDTPNTVLTMTQCPRATITGNTLIGNTSSGGITFGSGMAGSVMDETNQITAYVDNSGVAGDEVAITWLAENTDPSPGYHAVTERIIKRSAVIGSPKGWRCTTAGNPGTWTSEGNL